MSFKEQPKELEKDKYENLQELFKEWKESHKEDNNEICRVTFPKGRDDYRGFKGSFCPDGKFDDATQVEILFICRESNVGDGCGEQKDTDFWMRKVVKQKASDRNSYYDSGKTRSKNDKRKDRKAQTTYYNCLMAIANMTTEIKAQSADKLEKCAYMNINKRGGSSGCNMTRLKNYAILYQNYIKKEISMLNPKKIVVLGNLPKEILDIIGNPNHVYKRHPSVYSINLMNDFIAKL